MSGLELVNVTKRYGKVAAVDDAVLSVPPGSFVCLLGPSGCGKTTLMRMIAGLETPTSGDIRFEGASLGDRPVHRRDFGMVFQSLALFPHLSVGDNIAYPLKIRGQSKAEREARVSELLDLVRLPGVADRPVAQLSGGQRQRVAIARALAVSPRLFLLDEPLSALDAKLREAMQVELRQLQERLGITTIVVTHDQREAMTMADTIVVMQGGKIQQMDRPIDIYRRPANAFVADFLGQTNLLKADSAGGAAAVAGALIPGLALPAGQGSAEISVRPENVSIEPEGEAPIAATVEFVRDMGASVEVYLATAAGRMIAMRPAGRNDLAVGDKVSLGLDPAAIVVFPAGSRA
ncbi:ABC transporter ATP-binding protein [Aurantimonas endophytica]|uniref:Putative spermidine/putrescine transport system ATP-binding protein n=1 Tax=Aurantimonas endophytica TaxID=1522175 RepID=A0A7W6HG59_9HYPH|nr:ABC transporter ATP-binding protein [Aurantimonas endophytica]MBB4004348.1 putative spermidine/putrescine transport system ATP-binding protein [Aurantimonas endophytica]MCO6405188.1 ATP-binding cassette domain-containing protein [Aurantimonas endophytica]